jgi:hypothetical protein
MDGAVRSRDLRFRELDVRYATTFPEPGHLNADLTRTARRWLPDAWQRVRDGKLGMRTNGRILGVVV